MKKHLEDYLWNEIMFNDDPAWGSETHRSPRDVIDFMVQNDMIKSPKQAHATLNKWIGKGVYEYGCCLDLGWKCKKRLQDIYGDSKKYE